MTPPPPNPQAPPPGPGQSPPPPQGQAPPPQQQYYQQPAQAAAQAADPFAQAHSFIKMKFIMLGIAIGVLAIMVCYLLGFINNLLTIPSAPLGALALFCLNIGKAIIFFATLVGGALLPGLNNYQRVGFFIVAGFMGTNF